MTDTRINIYARYVGIFFILSMVCGWFGEVYVPSQMLAGDGATTADQLRANDALFRIGFAAYLVEAFSDVVIAWLFYVILKPVNRELALLSAFFGLLSTALFAVTKMLYYSAPVFLSESPQLAAFAPDQLDALAGAFISFYARLSGITFLFYGTAWLIRGYLTYRAGFLPRWLGIVMMAAGLGFMAKTVTEVLAPAWSSMLLVAPMIVNAIAVAGWMLVKGVDQATWAKAAERERGGM